MINPANVLDRIADEHLRLHPENPQDYPPVATPGITLDPPTVVGWFSLQDYSEGAAERWEPIVVQFSAVINGEQVATLRGI